MLVPLPQTADNALANQNADNKTVALECLIQKYFQNWKKICIQFVL